MMKRTSGTALTTILMMLTLTSCSKDLPVVEPTYSKVSDETVRIEVQLDAEDAEYIKREEIYLTLTSLECDSGANRYPAEAYVGQSKVSSFNFPIQGARITFHGDVPAEVFNRYERPCLLLEGGSYLNQSVSSKLTMIEPGAL
jgi:hypothetical protein